MHRVEEGSKGVVQNPRAGTTRALLAPLGLEGYREEAGTQRQSYTIGEGPRQAP